MVTNNQSNTPTTFQEPIPGFRVKPRRQNRKMSKAIQLEQMYEGCIDLETPNSILVNTNLRVLLNLHTFSLLSSQSQHKLMQLLPRVDLSTSTGGMRLNSSSLNNEFFSQACLQWSECLAEGGFTPQNQMAIKLEAERGRESLDSWKLKHFETTVEKPISEKGEEHMEVD